MQRCLVRPVVFCLKLRGSPTRRSDDGPKSDRGSPAVTHGNGKNGAFDHLRIPSRKLLSTDTCCCRLFQSNFKVEGEIPLQGRSPWHELRAPAAHPITAHRKRWRRAPTPRRLSSCWQWIGRPASDFRTSW